MSNLPPDSAIWRRESQGWSLADELRAQQIEVMDGWSRALYQAMHGLLAGKKPRQLPEPIRISHPGREPEKPRPKVVKDPETIKAFFASKFRGG